MDADPAATLRDFSVSLDTLESALAPLLARPLAETRDALGTIERAKLDVLIAYTINNLVWMYLKTRGIDPDTHGVAPELERVKTYYAKVRDAEAGKPQLRNRIDKDAAKRFIMHSIDAAPNSHAAMARRQAEAAVRERKEGESQATRSNRFRHVAKDAAPLSDPEDAEDEDEEMDVDVDAEPIADSEEEAAALLAQVYDEVDRMPVPEPSEARVDLPSHRAKRKRAEDLG
ncbi:hypothetical protein CC85DRAFT_289578 [Cutaneotrichosporon oleaginosum]|uniref:Exosome complex protein n=1 Tax=Cutaneotrichosporon oleaginosum TaxID=879819 RepID=A0A0J0XBD7_9TREE|nr:uncharacterized protein CC85DRAFT_289578 [Cutaneotrichosporon oleaginosum]KLT38375.1 hypothetical protein CC85DRAFT_289578 [Cutaneotrichosporon oleaginosum]TXT07052.1 hypothetical protein COLE_06383 [Cutaneotrichosporon oleaginosum]